MNPHRGEIDRLLPELVATLADPDVRLGVVVPRTGEIFTLARGGIDDVVTALEWIAGHVAQLAADGWTWQLVGGAAQTGAVTATELARMLVEQVRRTGGAV